MIMELVLQILPKVLAPQVLPGCSGGGVVKEVEERYTARAPHGEVRSASHRCELHGCCVVSAFLDMFGLPTIAANIVGLLFTQAANHYSKFY